MVARPGTYQASNNAGELAPEEYGRTDLKQFYAGLASAINIEPVPQGGSKLSMRTRHLGKVRKPVAAVSLTGTTVPSGSYAAGAVLATATFASAPICAVVINDWSASQALGTILQMEYLSGASWLPLGAAFAMGATNATITPAMPPGMQVTATSVRLRMVSAPPSSTTFSASALAVLAESSSLAVGRIRPFTFSLDQTYTVVLTNAVADIYRDGVWVATSWTGFNSDQIKLTDVLQRLDTMMLFHPQLFSVRILRNGSDTAWLHTGIPFEHVPVVDLGNNYGNKVADVWNLYLTFPTTSGDPYQDGQGIAINLNVNGEDSLTTVPGGTPDWTAVSAAIKTNLEGLNSVGSGGVSVVAGSPVSGTEAMTITFDGPNTIGNSFALVAEIVNTGNAAATVGHKTVASPGGEPLTSASAGYAAAAAFYQDRLITGGFNSKRGAFLASAIGEYFDQNITLQASSGAILSNLDTDGAEQIQHIVNDNYLVFFTSDAEYFISDRTIDRNQPPNVVNSSRYGSAPDLPVISNAGEVVWASRNKTVLYAASFDEISQKYGATPISLLAPHIVNSMVDMALQRPMGTANAARLWMPRADGSVTLGVMLRDQDVTAFVRWQTDGAVRSACVDGKNVPHFLVERTVNGVAELHIERGEDGLIFDAVVEQTFSPAQTVITGLDAHEGAVVWALADGYVDGPFTVAGGKITLGFASSDVQVGRWTPPYAKTLPLPNEVEERVVVEKPKNVHTVRIGIKDTTSIAIGANDRRARNVALLRAGDATDVPQPPVTDKIEVTGIAGWTKTGQAVITQTKPGQLAWTGITLEAT